MSFKSRAILKTIEKRPRYLLFPLVPLAMMLTNFALALTALRRVRQVSRRIA